MKLIPLFISIALGLAACTTPVTPEDIKNAQLPPQPKQAEIDKEVDSYFKRVLKDPESAKKECAPPRRAWARQFRDNPAKFGWLVVCDVNSKNSYGGYTGYKPYMFLFTTSGNQALDPSRFRDLNEHVQFLDQIK